MYLDEYLKRYSRAECVKLNMLKQKEGTVKDAVVKILRNLKVDSKVISQQEQKYTDEFENQFTRLIEEVKVVDQILSRTMFTTST